MESQCSTPGDCHVDIILEIVSSKDPGDEAPNANYFSGSKNCHVVLRVDTFHISSTILAAKSKFFSRLFPNGTEESDQGHVTIQIKESEEAAFIELLNFMYSGTLSSTTASELLNILMVAINFEVESCIRCCTVILRNIPMTTELALLYLEHLSQFSLIEELQPLIDSAKLFLRSRYKDIIISLEYIMLSVFDTWASIQSTAKSFCLSWYKEELMSFPLYGIEAVLSADDLHVTSEDDVFDFVLKWAKVHYPKLEKRREIIHSHLIKYIRFPYMSSSKLVEVPKCTELDKNLAYVSVHNALLSKIDALFVRASFLQSITTTQMDRSSIGSMDTKYESDLKY